MTEIVFEPCAVCLKFKSIKSMDTEKWGQVLCEFMEILAKYITGEGPCVIGHLKGFAKTSEQGCIKVSLVSASHPADVAGDIKGETKDLEMDLQLLVYGHGREILADLTKKTTNTFEKRWCGQLTAKSVFKIQTIQTRN